MFQKCPKKVEEDSDVLRDDKEFEEINKKVRINQHKFQRKNGVPVFLKAGAGDKALFFLTVGLSILGLVGTFEFIYSMAFPTSKEPGEPED